MEKLGIHLYFPGSRYITYIHTVNLYCTSTLDKYQGTLTPPTLPALSTSRCLPARLPACLTVSAQPRLHTIPQPHSICHLQHTQSQSSLSNLLPKLTSQV